MIQSRWPLVHRCAARCYPCPRLIVFNVLINLTPWPISLTFCSRSYIPLHYRLTRRVACAFYTGLPSYACQPNNVATEPFPSAYFVLVKIGGHARLNIINFSISPRILFCLTIILSLTGRGNHIWGVWINLCIFTVTYSIVFLLVAHHGMNS